MKKGKEHWPVFQIVLMVVALSLAITGGLAVAEGIARALLTIFGGGAR